jgi:hypothetical protein
MVEKFGLVFISPRSQPKNFTLFFFFLKKGRVETGRGKTKKEVTFGSTCLTMTLLTDEHQHQRHEVNHHSIVGINAASSSPIITTHIHPS